MHGLKQLVYDDQPFFPSNQSEKTNQELYILWKQNKRDDIFLLLYTQLWMALEEVYMENVIDYYKKDCYEKKLFFELVEYQKKFFKENIKKRSNNYRLCYSTKCSTTNSSICSR